MKGFPFLLWEKMRVEVGMMEKEKSVRRSGASDGVVIYVTFNIYKSI